MTTKAKTAVVVGVFIALSIGMITLIVSKRSASAEANSQQAKITATMKQVRQANVSLPDRQTQAKMLIMAAVIHRQIPDAANWCESLNAGGRIWPATPTNTAFAINTNVAGRALSRAINGDMVVFFEAANSGWNQAGGAELLAANSDGVAVAFADGRALIVTPAETASLRWTP